MGHQSKLTNAERAEIIERYNTGRYTRKQLAGIFGVAKSTIDNILANNTNSVKLKQPNTKFTPEDELRLIQLYREGTPIKRIADIMDKSLTSVYNCAIRLGIHTSKGSNSNQGNYVSGSDVVRKMSEAIYPEDLAIVRSGVKVGDIIKIRTLKSMSVALNTGASGNGVIRDARVVNVDHPRFCLVEILGSGFLESKFWVDMVMEQRRRERMEEVMCNG